MSIPEVLGLAGLLVAQFSLLWYKLGKVEQKIVDHCSYPHQKEEV